MTGKREQRIAVPAEPSQASSLPQERVSGEVKNTQVIDKMEISEEDDETGARQNPRRSCRDKKRKQMQPDNWEQSLFVLFWFYCFLRYRQVDWFCTIRF